MYAPNFSIFLSRTFWTVLGMFVLGGGNAVVSVLPPGIQTLVMGILGVLAVYFHINPSQVYNTPNN